MTPHLKTMINFGIALKRNLEAVVESCFLRTELELPPFPRLEFFTHICIWFSPMKSWVSTFLSFVFEERSWICFLLAGYKQQHIYTGCLPTITTRPPARSHWELWSTHAVISLSFTNIIWIIKLVKHEVQKKTIFHHDI